MQYNTIQYSTLRMRIDRHIVLLNDYEILDNSPVFHVEIVDLGA